MPNTSRRVLGLAVVALLGFALFNFPLLSLADGHSGPFGAPALLLYLFGVWAVLIVLAAVLRR